MVVPVNELDYPTQYECYSNLMKKSKSGSGTYDEWIHLLMEWDKVRLKLNPNAKKFMVVVEDKEYGKTENH